MTPIDNRSSDDLDSRTAEKTCPSCGGDTLSGASYCHACGCSLVEGSGGGIWPAGKIAGLSAVVVGLVAVSVFAVLTFSEPEDIPALSSSTIPPTDMFDAPPDLSRMTPREAADRLFNRIMTANEQGNREEARRFVPMAVQAYGGLPALDNDAHYHLGLIYGLAGDRGKANRHIGALRQSAPNHLLALILEHGFSKKLGETSAVSNLISAFTAAYDTEILMGRPEYEAHRNTIEKFRATAKTRPSLFPTEPVGIAQAGAQLFVMNCAGCHGRAADGSDKGPPLVHKVYESSHHDDNAFFRAVHDGVRPHHWSFGAMPPIPGISVGEVEKIITHVRELQRAAGIW